MALDALEAILTRRSTRHYAPDMVEDDKLRKILEAARQAPSGGNSQTNHFLVIRSRKVLSKLTEMTEKAFSRMEITDGMYPSLSHAVTASKEGGYVFCYDAPVLIAVANRVDRGNNMADCACAVENMLIAANALDLGSCYINQLKWLNEDPDLLEYFRSLGLKENERIYAAVILGYPAGGLPDRSLKAQKGNEITYID